MANVNAFGSATSNNRVGISENIDEKKYARKTDESSLDMQDFLNLLTAQLANQDVMNPSTDTQFIAQMAQFSSLQAMQTLTELTYAQYGTSMVGKNVLVASYDSKGDVVNETGVISHVKLMGGKIAVTVNGKDYDMSQVMDILNELPKPETKPDSDNGNGTDTTQK